MNEKEIARYAGIYDKLKRKDTNLSKEDIKFFESFKPTAPELEKIADYTGEGVDTISAGLLAMSTPEHKAVLMEHFNTAIKGKIAGSVRRGVETALAATDLGLSSQQISESRKALRASRRPTTTPLQASPELGQALNQAQQGTFDASRRIAPAQQALLDNYLGDMNLAQNTGQIGQYGAIGQVASTRRSRGAQALAPVVDDIKAREQARYDNLLQQKLGETRAIQQSMAQNYLPDLWQYRAEQEAAGELGAQGRSNLRGAIGNLAQQVPDVTANYAMKQRLDNIRNTMSQYGEPTAELSAWVDKKLHSGLKDYTNPVNPYYTQQLNKVAPTVMGGQLSDGWNMPYKGLKY